MCPTQARSGGEITEQRLLRLSILADGVKTETKCGASRGRARW